MSKAETQAKVKALASLQGQLRQAQEKVDALHLEAAKLQAEMSCMVRRSDLEDANARAKALEEAHRNDSQQHQAAVSEMQMRIAALEQERCEILSAMQV